MGGETTIGDYKLAAHRESFELPQILGIPPFKSSRALSQGKTLPKPSSTWLGIYIRCPGSLLELTQEPRHSALFWLKTL